MAHHKTIISLYPGVHTVLLSVTLAICIVVPREVPFTTRSDPREMASHSEVGFSIPSSACGLCLEIAVREWEPNSTQGVCGSRNSPPTLRDVARPGLGGLKPPKRNPSPPPHANEFQPMKCSAPFIDKYYRRDGR